MCQMCDEYEAELQRMGVIADARKLRDERHREERKLAPAGEKGRNPGPAGTAAAAPRG